MGVIYYVACKDCKVMRDLDKFYTLHFCGEIKNRDDALKMCDETRKDSFRSTLLLSFLSRHYGHNITMFDDSGMEDEWDEYKEDVDFWS